ncbi:MAG TPA: flippase [Candidatus Bathyarchaeia archaeon]
MKQSAKGSLILVIGQVISTVISALGMIYVSRVLGSTSFGVVSIAQVPIGFAYILMNLGTDQALIKYIAQYKYEGKTENLKLLIESGLFISLVVGLFYTLLLWFSAGYLASSVFNQPELEILIKILSLGVVGQSIITSAWAIILGYERMTLKSLNIIVFSLLKSLFGPVLVYLGYGPVGAVLGESGPLIFSSLLGLVFIYFIWKSEHHSKASLSHFEGVKMLLDYGFPLFLANIVTGPRSHINSYLLSVYVAADLIGNYSVATRFSVLVGLVATPISQVILPLFSKLESNIDDLKFVYQNSIKYTSLIIFPVIAVIIALSTQIIQVLYDGDYQQAPLYMNLYLAAYFFVGIGSISNLRLLNSRKLTKDTFNVMLLQTVVTLPLTYLLILRWGVIGMLVSELVGPRFGMLYGIYVIKKKFGFTFDYSSSLKLFVSAFAAYLVSSTVFSVLGLNPWLELVLGSILVVVIYIGGIVVLRVLVKRDIHDIRSVSDAFGPLAEVFRLFIGLIGRFVGE